MAEIANIPNRSVLAACRGGCRQPCTKVALEQVSPLDLFAVEVAMGALVLCAAALARGARPSRPSIPVLALGILDPGLAILLFDFGLVHTAATHGALLLATDSLFTVALAVVLLGERVGGRVAVALAAGFAGSALLSLDSGGTMSTLSGDALVVAAALSAAVYAVLARRVVAGRNALSLTAEQMLGAAVVALPLAAVMIAAGHSHLTHADAGHLLVTITVALLSSVVPFVLYNIAIGGVTAPPRRSFSRSFRCLVHWRRSCCSASISPRPSWREARSWSSRPGWRRSESTPSGPSLHDCSADHRSWPSHARADSRGGERALLSAGRDRYGAGSDRRCLGHGQGAALSLLRRQARPHACRDRAAGREHHGRSAAAARCPRHAQPTCAPGRMRS